MGVQRTGFATFDEERKHRQNVIRKLQQVQGIQALLDEWEAQDIDSDAHRDYLVHLRARLRFRALPIRVDATMKDLKAIFPRASDAFLRANRQAFVEIAEMFDTQDKKTTASANSVRLRATTAKGMNATERSFSLMLEAQRNAGEIVSWRYESVKLRLGDGCWYTPDFFVERGAGPLFVEVKGFLRDDARVKFIAAREIHRWAAFEMVRKTKDGWLRIL